MIRNLHQNATNDEKRDWFVVPAFMEEMLKAMENTIDAEDGLFGGSASADIYRSMLREQLATAMSGHMKSPLETELTKALQKAAPAAANETRRFARVSKVFRQ